ncbi:MAG: ion transporter [Gammaproteobacteria bacterium]
MTEERKLSDGVNEAGEGRLRRRVFELIFMSDTAAGRNVDLLLLVAILASVAAIVLSSISSIHEHYGVVLFRLEWLFTGLFTVEYIIRLWCLREPRKYVFSFFGVVDLMSVLPAYLELLTVGSSHLLVIRLLRILRLFRVLKLGRYVGAAQSLVDALRLSSKRILIFLYVMLTLVTIFGAVMYMVEGPENGFNSIPEGIYWAIVTLTTVGFGDITPQTNAGRVIASLAMIMGYAIIAVPTGIFAAGMRDVLVRNRNKIRCPECALIGHAEDAQYCRRCSASLTPREESKTEA